MGLLDFALRAAGFLRTDEKLRNIARQIVLDHPYHPATEDGPIIHTPFTNERLKEIAVAAHASSGKDWHAAKEALLRAVQNDASLLWALFEDYRGAAAHRLLSQVSNEIRAYAKRAEDAQIEQARPVAKVAAPAASTARTSPLRPPTAGKSEILNVTRLSMLDRFRPAGDGRSIGDYTPPEARRWAKAANRDVRFVELLTANLPETGLIRRYRTPEDADRFYQQAQEEADAA